MIPIGTVLKRLDKPIRDYKGRVVGVVSNGIFIKHFKGSRHLIRLPEPALANGIEVLQRAKEAGAWEVMEVDDETGNIYYASIEHIQNDGEKIFFPGNGEQIKLPLRLWKCEAHPKAKQDKMF